MSPSEPPQAPTGPVRDVPVDWEALEDAFENNAPEVHSYLHLGTGDVLRVVDGVADPQMHTRIASDTNYLRIDPVSSREQYRWMERYIPMVETPELTQKLTLLRATQDRLERAGRTFITNVERAQGVDYRVIQRLRQAKQAATF